MSRATFRVVGSGSAWLLALAMTPLAGVPASAITGGAPVAEGSHAFAASLAIGDERRCSGALVAPGWVAASRSCFPGNPLVGPPTPATTVTVGRSDLGVSGTGRVRTVTYLVQHPDRDVVLARLDAIVLDVAPVRITSIAPSSGQVVHVAGYGRTATEWTPERLSAAAFSVGSVTDATIDLLGVDPSGASTCRGDAGGPVFRSDGGVTELVAVSSASWQRGCLGESETRQGSTATRLDNVSGWISETTSRLTPATVALTNPGFESGLTGWTQFGAGGGAASNAVVWEGASSARVTDAGATTSGGLESTRVGTVPGVQYTAYARVQPLSGSPSLYLRFYDAAGELVGNFSTSLVGGAGRWTLMETRGTAPGTATRMSVLLYSSTVNVGTTHFDHITVARSANKAVPNPGFESGLTGWTQFGAGGGAASNAVVWQGASSARVTDASATTSAGLESTRVGAAPGVQYTAYARVQPLSGSPSLYLRFYDAAGELVGNFSTSLVGGAGRWTLMETRGTAPGTATRMSVLLYSSQANVGTAHFDEITIQ